MWFKIFWAQSYNNHLSGVIEREKNIYCPSISKTFKDVVPLHLLLYILFEVLATKKNLLYDNSIYGRDLKKESEREMEKRKAVLR